MEWNYFRQPIQSPGAELFRICTKHYDMKCESLNSLVWKSQRFIIFTKNLDVAPERSVGSAATGTVMALAPAPVMKAVQRYHLHTTGDQNRETTTLEGAKRWREEPSSRFYGRICYAFPPAGEWSAWMPAYQLAFRSSTLRSTCFITRSRWYGIAINLYSLVASSYSLRPYA